MKTAPVQDPKTILQALRNPSEPLEGWDSSAVQRARQLLGTLSEASAAAVAALPEPLALAVVEGATQARLVPLMTALSESPAKPIAKAAKKALYQLRSLGVSVPEKRPASAAEVSGPPATSETAELPSLLSAVTGTGERALVVPRSHRGGLEVSQIIVTDEHGVVHYSRTEMSRSAYRKNLRELDDPSAPPVLLVERDEARALLAEASAQNRRSQSQLPNGADDFLRRMDIAPAPTPLEVPVPEADDERRSTRGNLLHNEPEIQPWLPPEAQLRFLAAKAESVRHSPLEMSEAQRNEQIVHQFRAAAREFFTPELSKLYARRLWRMGDFFARVGRTEPAAIARAEARRLFHGHREPFSRFAEFLFEKVLLLTQHLPQPAGGPGPGHTPAESDPEAAERGGLPERKSPGGLILP